MMSKIKCVIVKKIGVPLVAISDIVHYGKVVSALGETIHLMREVDGVIESAGGWAVK